MPRRTHLAYVGVEPVRQLELTQRLAHRRNRSACVRLAGERTAALYAAAQRNR